MEIKNLKELALKIKKSIQEERKIILFADSDLDGVASLIILEETLKCLGALPGIICFSDRELGGYGFNFKALNQISNEAPALLVTLDCGISNFNEIKEAVQLGFEVVIIDHHQVLEKLPEEASLVVNPKQLGDDYPFKKLANTGIVYYLAKRLLTKKISLAIERSFLELTAIATLADMMEEQADNKTLVENGLATLLRSQRPGFQALVDLFSAHGLNNARQISQKIISVLNITDFVDNLPKSYVLLTSASDYESAKLAQELYEQSQQRNLLIWDIVAAIDLDLVSDRVDSAIIFAGNPGWKQVLTGAVASRLCNKHQKPTFIFKKGEEISRGSLRTPKGIDSVKALKTCSQYLETYGGHPQASGFCFKTKYAGEFERCLNDYFRS